MRPFEYARAETEAEAVELLVEYGEDSVVLAGGTDLISLMQRDVLQPRRVVDIKRVESMRGVSVSGNGIAIGALTTLEELVESPLAADYAALADVVDGIRAIQVQQSGTIAGDLCLMPNCWYFRNGYGILGRRNGESMVENGDNRYHAVFGSHGPAKFVNASRFAPALIAWRARVRIIGPESDREELIPLEYFYRTPRTEDQRLNVLRPGQLISHVLLPSASRTQSASWDVLEMEGLDWPLVAAAATLDLEGGVVRAARVVMGHVAPIPWVSDAAANAIMGYAVNDHTADAAGDAAVENATPLSHNEYKVYQAKAAVKRALLKAAGQWNPQPAEATSLV